MKYSNNVSALAALVRIALKVLSNNDPTGLRCMNMKSIGSSRWYFSFCSVPFFITTFSSCYGSSSSRFVFANEKTKHSCFILFQPEISFLRHNLDFDTPGDATRWQNPITPRDKIRVNFRKHGREYHIPATTKKCTSHHIVLPDADQFGGTIDFWDESVYPD